MYQVAMPPNVIDFTADNPDEDALNGDIKSNPNFGKPFGIGKPTNLNFHEIQESVM